jgi:hypothetical protein
MSQNIVHFYDPNHGNCLRIMYQIDTNKYIINGGYGSDEGGKGHWAATLEKKRTFVYNNRKYNCIIDFSMKKKKTHEAIYYAYWTNRQMQWQDGNTWLELYF